MTQASAVEKWFGRVLDVPLVRLLGALPRDPRDPAAGIVLQVGAGSLNAAGVTHGGALATGLDLAAYLAVLPTLAPFQQAVTVSFSACYLAATRGGDRLEITASVLRRSRNVALLEAVATSASEPIATALVTKAITADRS